MGRPKGSRNKSNVKSGPKKHKDPNVEDVIETEVEFDCPVRGRVKQKVKIKKLKPVENDARAIVGSSDDIDGIDGEETDLPLYDDDMEQ